VDESEPNAVELKGSLEGLFYVAAQCGAYHYWVRQVKPQLGSEGERYGFGPKDFIGNSIIEATLLFIRKTNEFFKAPAKKHKPDTLYAYRFSNYCGGSEVLSAEEEAELHKRVGHITARGIRQGPKEWPIYDLVKRSLTHWQLFFEFLALRHFHDDLECKGQVEGYANVIEDLIRKMNADVEGTS
jgi:hypothetical protein